jgi:hypothetical protein
MLYKNPSFQKKKTNGNDLARHAQLLPLLAYSTTDHNASTKQGKLKLISLFTTKLRRNS